MYLMLLPALEKLKQGPVFSFRFNSYKSKDPFLRKGKQDVPQKRFHSHYVRDCHRSTGDWEITISEKRETHKRLKKRETIWLYKAFYPLGLIEKEGYFFTHST